MAEKKKQPRMLTPVKASPLFMATRYEALPEALRRAINPKEFRQLKSGGTVAVGTEVAKGHPNHIKEDVSNGDRQDRLQ